MHKKLCLDLALMLFLTGASASVANAQNQKLQAAAARPPAVLSAVPLSFEPNLGQTDRQVQFLSRGSGYSLFLTPGEVVLNLERQNPAASSQLSGQGPNAARVDTLRMMLAGANPDAAVAGLDPQPGVVNYLIGNDPKKWHAGIPTYGKVTYKQIYPGVDLVFYGNQRQLEYDFVVAPGADPSRIAWQIDGASASIDPDGNLVLNAAGGPASFKKPAVYQINGDKKIAVDGAFALANNKITFRMGSYDRARPLVIDPVLSYSSYLGGSNTDNIGNFLRFSPGTDNGATQALAVDSEGSVYVTGYTYSTNFPTKDPYLGTHPIKMSGSNWPSVFVTKFSPNGGSLVYSTYLGGNGLDYGYAIAVDSNLEAYVTGSTSSPNFPTTAGAYQTICSPAGGSQEVASCSGLTDTSTFVTKLNASGTGLVYSTFLSGVDGSTASAIAVDSTGRTYVVGNVEGYCRTGYAYTCFPTTTGAVIGSTQVLQAAPQNAFASVFDPTGTKLLYSTLFGDLNQLCTQNCIDYPGDGGFTYGTGVTVDANGNFYLIGSTEAGKLPTTTGVIQPNSGPFTAQGYELSAVRGFVAKFNPITSTGSTLAHATYLGGQMAGLTDYTSGIVADSAGNSYITGFTDSPDFPVTPGAYQATCFGSQSCASAYVAKLNASLSSIEWATYLGDLFGAGDDVALTGPIQLDGDGNVYITGESVAGGLPTVHPIEPNTGNFQEMFVAEFNPTGSELLFSTPIGNGGAGNNVPYTPAGLGVDAEGNIYLAGNTQDTGLIVTSGAFQTASTDGACCVYGNGFVAKIAAQGTVTAALVASPSPSQAGQKVTLTATVTQSQKYASLPTGTVTFEDGPTTLSTVAISSSGVAAYSTTALTVGNHNLTAHYNGDTTYPAVNGMQTLTVKGQPATVKVTPAATAVVAAASLKVTATVTGAGATPTGTVTLSGPGYTSSAEALSGGSYVFTVPANSFKAGTDTLTVNYSGDSYYASNTATATVTVSATPLTPVVKVTPAKPSINAATSLSVAVAVTGIGVTPTGTTTLTASGYTSSAEALSTGSYTFTIPANILKVGVDTLTVNYSGDSSYTATTGTASVTVTQPPLQFIPVTPCRIADTRNAAGAFGGPELTAGAARTFNVPQSACGVPASAVAYSLNVTVVPIASLGYLSIWPAGEAQPTVSTLNSTDGRVKANATITPAGTNGGVSVFASDATQFILDIDGYFVPAGTSASGLEFYPLTPCRIADTRNATGALGGPSLTGGVGRAFPVQSSACGIPSTARAYSLNITAVPHGSLGYLTTWPTGQAQPVVSTLNATTGAVTANAAIVPAGSGGDVSIFVSDTADVILDVNGYFAPPATGGLSLYTVTPCRAIDTRNGAGAFHGTLTVPIHASTCTPPTTAQAYILNATVIPASTLNYLTLWAAGEAQPVVSTLNANDGAVTSNMAIVPTANGSIDAFASDSTQLILDLSSYFAP
jgi:hypothetical protein